MKVKIALFTLALTALFFLTGCGAHEKISEKLAVSMINSSFSENQNENRAIFGKNATKCEKVVILRKISFGTWRARAYFDNGAEMDCIIENMLVYQQVKPDNGSIRRGK